MPVLQGLGMPIWQELGKPIQQRVGMPVLHGFGMPTWAAAQKSPGSLVSWNDRSEAVTLAQGCVLSNSGNGRATYRWFNSGWSPINFHSSALGDLVLFQLPSALSHCGWVLGACCGFWLLPGVGRHYQGTLMVWGSPAGAALLRGLCQGSVVLAVGQQH